MQIDVEFVDQVTPAGKRVRRFQYTAIDDATRICTLQIYDRHSQVAAIDLVDRGLEKLSFRIKQIRTGNGNGHEFQARFHWHVADPGIEHAYIKPRPHASTVRSSARTEPMLWSSTSCSPARTTSI